MDAERYEQERLEEIWEGFRPTMTQAQLIAHLIGIGMTEAEATEHAAKCITTDRPES